MVGVIESNSGDVVAILSKDESSYDIRPLYLLARARKRTPRTRTLLQLCAACPDRRFWPLRRGQLGPHSGL